MKPTTEFYADECQALLDFIDKLGRKLRADRDEYPGIELTEDERSALDKLREAGKFYVPTDRVVANGSKTKHF